MNCPHCGDGLLTITYDSVPYIEFLLDYVSEDGSFHTGEIFDIEFGNYFEIHCTNECPVTLDYIINEVRRANEA